MTDDWTTVTIPMGYYREPIGERNIWDWCWDTFGEQYTENNQGVWRVKFDAETFAATWHFKYPKDATLFILRNK